MITEELARNALAASAAAYDNAVSSFPDAAPGARFERVGEPITDAGSAAPTGFNAAIYRSLDNPGEYIVAFTGTQDAKDAFADVSLGTEQWQRNRARVFERLRDLTQVRKLTFAGHSLGGALAQYAAYDYGDPKFQNPTAGVALSVVSFNGLSARDGIEQMHNAFDPSRLAGVSGAHFVDARDVVARLGGGHVGGVVVAHDFGSRDAASAHKLDTSFLAPANRASALLADGQVMSQAYVDVSGAQRIASIAASFFNVGGVSESEAALRSVGGALMAMSFAPSAELNALGRAFFPDLPVVRDWGTVRDGFNAALAGRVKNDAALLGASVVLAGTIVQEANIALDAARVWTTDRIEQMAPQIREAAEVAGSARLFAEEKRVALAGDVTDLIESAVDGYRDIVERGASGMQRLVAAYDQAQDFSQTMAGRAAAFYADAIMWMGDQLGELVQVVEATGSTVAAGFGERIADSLQRINGLQGPPALDAVKALALGSLSDVARIARALEHVLPGPVGAVAGYVSDSIRIFDLAAMTSISPLVIDLDGDGYELSPRAGSSVFFDLDTNGFAEQTGWVNADDGLLVLDRNGNARIDDGTELFGDHTPVAGGVARDGFAALATFDGNADHRIDAADGVFGDLRVWRDRDQNGRADSGELATLGALGISSISIDAAHSSGVVAGHSLALLSSVTRADGSSTGIADVYFQTDRVNTRYARSYALDLETLLLPALRGYGHVADLHIAMSRDATLTGLVRSFAARDFSSAASVAAALDAFDAILFRWTGAGALAAGSRGSHIDARKLGTLEAFFDRGWYSQRVLSTAPGDGHVALILDTAFEHLKTSMAARVIAQIRGGDGAYDFSADALVGVTRGDAPNLRTFSGTGGADVLVGDQYVVSNRLIGGAGDDILFGVRSRDTLEGGEGNDVLLAGKQGARFFAGAGNDRLRGGLYRDEYHFSPGDGRDVIQERGGSDRLYLTGGISPGDIEVTRENLDLLMDIGANGDQIRVRDWYASAARRIEEVRFDDGGVLTGAVLSERGAIVHGSEGNDTLTGVAGVARNRLYGEAGDDTLTGMVNGDYLDGGAGDDELSTGARLRGTHFVGGPGADTLRGGYYDDHYYFNAGDGVDVIDERGGGVYWRYDDELHLGPGIAPGDVRVSREGTDLIVGVGAHGDAVCIKAWYESLHNRVEWLHFDDGTRWDAATLARMGAELHGTAGADTLIGLRAGVTRNSLYGEGGDDTLAGVLNDDRLYGGAGADTLAGGQYRRGTQYTGGTGADVLDGGYYDDYYSFDAGDGADLIDERGGNTYWRYFDHLSLGEGIDPGAVRVVREGTDMLVKTGDGADTVRIRQWYQDRHNRVEWLHFRDGTAWDAGRLAAEGNGNIERHGTPAADAMSVASGARHLLYGEGGDDTLSGGPAADDLTGGKGDDRLEGGAGSDSYHFFRGDAADTVRDTGGSADRIVLHDVRHDALWLWRENADLVMAVPGSVDRIAVEGWFADPDGVVEAVVAGDGYRVSGDAVSQLVDAMARFGATAPGTALMEPAPREDLAAALAAAWQPV